jgi:hypothetical protein
MLASPTERTDDAGMDTYAREIFAAVGGGDGDVR